MLSAEELGRVCVVLVRARNPSNIGAVARAMHDFGFVKMRVVNAFPVPFEAARSAVDASAVMAGAEKFTSVAEAVGDCTLVVGTTAVGERDLRHDLLMLPEAAMRMRAELRRGGARAGGGYEEEEVGVGPECGGLSTALRSGRDDDRLHDLRSRRDDDRLDALRSGRDDDGLDRPGGDGGAGRVALLFGSEKTGLSNEEMSHCNWLLTVPMQEYDGVRHPSMNLGQAVAVCLYELVRDAPDDVGAVAKAPDRAAEVPALAGDLERLSALLSEVLEKTEYTRRHPAEKDPAQMRRMVRRMGVEAKDAQVWMGILRQVLWKLGGSR